MLINVSNISLVHGQEDPSNTISCQVVTKDIASAEYTPVAKHFHKNSGLASLTNNFHVLVDRRGYTWISGIAGVSRYDGYDFVNFNTSDGLPERLLIKSYEDYKGRIWFLSYSGALSFFENGKIHEYEHNETLVSLWNGDGLASFHVDSAENLHLGLYGKGYLKVTPQGEVETIVPKDSAHLGMGLMLLEDSVPFYFDVFLKGQTHRSRGKATFYSSSLEILDTFNLFEGTGKIAPFPATIRFIQLADKSYLLSRSNVSAHFYLGKPLERVYSPGPVISIFEDVNQGIWIGTSQKGVFYYPNGINDDAKVISYFSESVISWMAEDHENGLWVVTANKGLYYLPMPYVSNFGLEKLFDNKYSDGDYYGRKEFKGGELYMTNNGGVLFYSQKDQFKAIDFKKDIPDLTNLRYQGMSYMPQREVFWVAGRNHLYKLQNGKVNQFESTYGKKPIGRGLNSVSYHNREDELIVSVRGNICKIKNDSLVHRTKGSTMDMMLSSTESSDTGLWIAARNGLWKYKDTTLIHYGAHDSLLNTSMSNVKEFKGVLWAMSSKHGLLKMPLGEKAEVFTYQGRDFQNVNSFMDVNDTLYFFSLGALNRLTFTKDGNGSEKVDYIPLGSSFIGSDIAEFGKWKQKFTYVSGDEISVFNHLPKFQQRPGFPLIIEQLLINNRDTGLLIPHYDLSYKQNYISIKYLAPSTRSGGHIFYKYRVKGLDPDWIETKDRQVRYTSITPGTYKFELYAKGLDEIWTRKPATISFTISPPFWKTWWFISLSILVIVSLVSALVRYRFLQLKRENILQMALNESRQQALSARMNPHFIFNALNSIKTYVLENDVVKSNDYIARFGKLMRQILDQSQFTLVPLSQELEALDNYVKLELMRGKDRFSYTSEIDSEIDLKTTMVPSLLLQPFIENAIWHGIMPKKGPGSIRMTIKMVDDRIECTIEDDGIGRRLKQNEETHNSAATEITNRRLQLINTRYETHIEVRVDDLKNEENVAIGTRVVIPFPRKF